MVPSASGAPTSPTPVAPIGAWTLLAWVRREIAYALGGDQNITASPVTVSAQLTGQRAVQGWLDAQGPNGDPVTYKVTQQPTDGTVVVNRDGTYTYTPNADFPVTGGTDTFTVQVTDAQLHIANLFGAPAKSISVPVGVNVVGEEVQTVGSSSSYSLYTYNLHNFTDTAVEITDYKDQYVTAGGVYWPEGTVIQPGQSLPFQLSNQNSSAEGGNYLDVVLTPVGATDATSWTVGMDMINFGYGQGWQTYSSCTVSGGASCSPQPDGLIYQTSTIDLLNANPTTITIDASNPDAQQQILNNVCADSSATCTYAVKSQKKAVAPGKPPVGWSDVANNTAVAQSTNYTITDTVTTETSLSVSDKVEAKLLDAVKASVSATYSKTLTQTATYTNSITQQIPAYTTAVFTDYAPVVQYDGDFTVEVGNTTWLLKDVTVNDPDPNPNPPAPGYNYGIFMTFTPITNAPASSAAPVNSTPAASAGPPLPTATTAAAPALSAPTAAATTTSLLPRILGWLRSEIAYDLGGFTKPVTLSPQQITATSGGSRQEIGTLGAVNPTGDPLTYKVIQQPSNGTVVINPAGTFTYTPDASFPASGGMDGFVVTATDSAFHLANLLGAPVASTTTDVQVSVPGEQLGSSEGYDVYNLTTYKLYINRYVAGSATASGDSIPRVGSAIDPGSSAHFVLANGETITPQITLSLNPNYIGEQWQVTVGNGKVTCSASSDCDLPGSALTQGYLLNPSFTEADASDPGSQNYVNAVLNLLCGQDANCSFMPTSFEHTQGNQHVATGYVPLINGTTIDGTSDDYTVTQTVTTKTSWSVSASVETKLGPIVTNTVSATYGESTATTDTYSQKISIKVPAMSEITIYFTDPVIRYTGTWVVSVGDSTILLDNASTDYPDPGGNGQFLLNQTAYIPPG